MNNIARKISFVSAIALTSCNLNISKASMEVNKNAPNGNPQKTTTDIPKRIKAILPPALQNLQNVGILKFQEDQGKFEITKPYRHFICTTSLERLNVMYKNIGGLDSSFIMNFPNLKELNISGPIVSSLEFLPDLDIPLLQTLYIKVNGALFPSKLYLPQSLITIHFYSSCLYNCFDRFLRVLDLRENVKRKSFTSVVITYYVESYPGFEFVPLEGLPPLSELYYRLPIPSCQQRLPGGNYAKFKNFPVVLLTRLDIGKERGSLQFNRKEYERYPRNDNE